MFGENVHRLNVLLLQPSQSTAGIVVFQKDGNYGDNWNYGQVTLYLTTEVMVSDITQEVHKLISSMCNVSAVQCDL